MCPWVLVVEAGVAVKCSIKHRQPPQQSGLCLQLNLACDEKACSVLETRVLSESPGGCVKTQIAEPHPKVSNSVVLESLFPTMCISISFQDADVASLGTPLFKPLPRPSLIHVDQVTPSHQVWVPPERKDDGEWRNTACSVSTEP